MHQLIQACQANNAFAQKRLYELLAKRMFRLCKRYVTIQEDAEEMLMNGFLKMFKALPNFQYKDERSFEAWVKSIMVNECLMLMRKKKMIQFSIETLEEKDTVFEPESNQLEADDLYNLILSLPLGYRTVFNLHAIEGYSHQEIAQKLGITEGTSKSQLSKARKMLQEKTKANEANQNII